MTIHPTLLQEAGVEIVRPTEPQAESDFTPRGRFTVEHWRGGRLIDAREFPNGITSEGKNKLLDVQFHAASQITSWFLGLIDDAGYTALADTDTYDAIDQVGNGWDEFQGYTDAAGGDSPTTRPAWPVDAASSQSITNSSVAVFDITVAGTVKGLFLVGGVAGANLKGNHEPGGTLWATALFASGDVVVQNGDQLKITYTVSA
jgi:hypothetical protein